MSLSQPADDLAAGRVALEAGAWQQALQAFERAVKAEESPEALEGLGLAAWWLDLAPVVFDSRERAYRAYRGRRDQLSAARVAIWIAWDSAAFRGEEGVAKGWLAARAPPAGRAAGIRRTRVSGRSRRGLRPPGRRQS